ncbi:protein-methionine-sulfoxide reductase heme-binding subunit MsrQ [Marinimicrobium alkaliphilum]|uniref:sulfite oxidase heme-binding subunit YedZ n=1 Tax=Marinimicrobium alkaliphilum TaxID=2202654 RepID=UPI001E2FCDC4|nr:protein-methionine-sulfoxide reductase heme-binding subunit MsrQ [Marinimicrobium alkaliphilum]
MFLVGVVPLLWITYRTVTHQLGADPAQTIVLFLGEWALYFLFASLAVTPIRRLVRWRHVHFRWLQTHRRMLGLFCLFYVLLHITAYLVFILGLDFARFGQQLVERPYILVTMPAVVLLIALGVTSTQGMMRRLGKRWLTLHKSIYLVALLAWVHVFMQVRSSYVDAVLYGVIILLLLAPRVIWWWRKH